MLIPWLARIAAQRQTVIIVQACAGVSWSFNGLWWIPILDRIFHENNILLDNFNDYNAGSHCSILVRMIWQIWASFVQSHGDLAPPGSEDGCRAPTIAQNIAQSCHLIQPVIIRIYGFTVQGKIRVSLSTVKKIVNGNLFLICHGTRNSVVDDFPLAYRLVHDSPTPCFFLRCHWRWPAVMQENLHRPHL